MTPKEQLIAWLNDAYGTELAQVPVLENHAKDAEAFPDIRDRDLQHLEETRRQAERLQGIITGLGGEVSTVKSTIYSIFGTAQSVATGAFQDELLKNFLNDYAAEHFEIASYKGLIIAAEQAGAPEIILTLQESLREEEAMASWIEDNLPKAIGIVMSKHAANATA